MLWRPLAATAVALLAAAAPAGAAEPIMPLGDVRPGMQCTGLTVIRGAEIAAFDVEVLDVVAGDPVADQPLLLVRVSGPAAAPTGIAEGFSGSPVVCDGRIAGAIAYGTGDYGNELGFATPIEAVLGEAVNPPPGVRHRPRLVRRARPLATPLTVSGVAPAVFAPFAKAAERSGLTLRQAPAAPPADRFPAQPLRPGASMAAGLASGDVTLSAIGTVSYVDGDDVWGFGHPLESAGRRSLFLQDAWVYTVVDNPLGVEGAVSYKLAAPARDVGTLTTDGRNGVAGVLGTLPPQVPLRIEARSGAAAPRVVRARLADETAVGLPGGVSPATVVAPMALAQAAYVALDGSPLRQSASMCVRISMRELRRPARFCNRYVGSYGALGGGDVTATPYVFDLTDALLAVDDFRYGMPHVTGIDVELDVRSGLRQALIRDVRGPRTLRRGETVSLRLDLQRYRGARYTRRVELRVPRRAPLGSRRLVVTGTSADADYGEVDLTIDGGGIVGGGAEGPKTFAGLAKRIRSIARFDGVTFRLARPRGRGGRPHVLLRGEPVRISGSGGYRVRVAAPRGGEGRGRATGRG